MKSHSVKSIKFNYSVKRRHNLVNFRNRKTMKRILKLPIKIVQAIRLISGASTASKAYVFHIKLLGDKHIVCKITRNIINGGHEINMYKLLNNLVNRYVTPAVLKYIRIPNPQFIDNVRKIPYIRKYTKQRNSAYLFTETYTNNNITTFHKLKSISQYEIYTMYFQILYTLECFRRIGMSHNDLHHDNIFVITLNPQSGNTYKRFIYKSINNEKRTFYVRVKGKHPRIFDYDRSISMKNKTLRHSRKVHTNLILSKKYRKQQHRALSFDPFYREFDEKRDLIRFLFPHLRNKSPYQQLALSLFNLNHPNKLRNKLDSKKLNMMDTEYLKYDYLVDKNTYKPIKLNNIELPSLDTMLMSKQFKILTKLPKNSIVIETYNINNIYQ